MKEYKKLVNAIILSTTQTRSQMVLNCLKDVSTMLAIVSAIQTWVNCAPDADRACSGTQKSLRRAGYFGRAHFALQKRKKSLDPQVFGQTGTAMKELQSIPNTIMNTNLLVIFS